MISKLLRCTVPSSSIPRFCHSAPVPTTFTQGQKVGDKQREYFYFIDHQGQLFLDDTKIKNFVTCYKDKGFLRFFFRRLRTNNTGRYHQFPFYSPCGPEINFVHCDDLPVVFSQLSQGTAAVDLSEEPAAAPPPPSSSTDKSTEDYAHKLWYGSDTHQVLSVDFQPASLFMLPGTGRVYHAAPEKFGGIGLVKSSLAIELAKHFVYADAANADTDYPTGFKFQGTVHALENKFAQHFAYTDDSA